MKYFLLLLSFIPFMQSTAQTLLISNVNIVDVKQATIIQGQDVLIDKGVIANIGKNLTIPPKTTIVDAKQGYLIPGLWDMHSHLQDLGEKSLNQYLYYGITQVRDMGGEPELIGKYQQEISQNNRLGPDIYSALYMIGSPRFAKIMEKFMPNEQWQQEQKRRIIVGDQQQAVDAVNTIHQAGADFVKLHWNHDQQTLKTIIQRARELGLDVVGHDPGPTITLLEIAKSGLRSYEHVDGDFFYKLSQLNNEKMTETITAFKDNDVHVSATLVIWSAFTRLAAIEDKSQAADLLAQHPDGLTVDGKLIEFWKKMIPTFGPQLITWEQVDQDIHYLRKLYQSGVKLLASTDSGIPGLYPGYSLIEELALLQEKVGVSPAEALKMATLDAAKFMHLDKQLGSVEPGKTANLVLLEDNPLRSVNALYRISHVIKQGVSYPRQTLTN